MILRHLPLEPPDQFRQTVFQRNARLVPELAPRQADVRKAMANVAGAEFLTNLEAAAPPQLAGKQLAHLQDADWPTGANVEHLMIRAAALQYVRKVSGATKPTALDEAAFAKAVDEVTRATTALLATLAPREPKRTREGEREKAKKLWARRVQRMGS